MRILFIFTIFAGSALLFLVQPLIAKELLPIFGGSPLVWNTSLMFFQAMLLLGYLYAHHSIRLLGAKRQAIVHCLVMVAAAAVLPLRVPEALRAAYENALVTAPNGLLASPAPMLLAMLVASVGLPFFALSAGAPTLQRWFAQTSDPQAKDPYFLYQASNLASMFALLGYPLWFERVFALHEQSVDWSWGYAVLLILMAACAIRLNLGGRAATEPEVAENPDLKAEITRKDKVMWVFLAACPTAMLGAMTTYLTTNLAPIPLLWVLPLALYLVTFVVAFAKGFNGRLVKYYAMAALFLVVVFMLKRLTQPLWVALPIHFLGFFLTALACHWEIAKNRPRPQHLTSFYVWISVGGVIGGFFVAIVAPLVFNTLAEYPVSLVLAFVAIALAQGPESRLKWQDFAVPAVAIALTLLARQGSTDFTMGWLYRVMQHFDYAWIYLALLAMVICAMRPMRFAFVLLGLLGFSLYFDLQRPQDVIYRRRDFFGVLTVSKERFKGDTFHVLLNGTIIHGAQQLDGPRRFIASTYYTPTSGLGRALTALGDTPLMDHVASVGLGVGTIAAYGRQGMNLDFYEINPQVEQMARNPNLFTYLSDSKATIRVLIGDARLRLRTAPPGLYGLISLDAFSSDAIPVHLLTREALQTYLRALAPHGIIAVHISNRFLNLEPVVCADADDLGLSGCEINTHESAAIYDTPSMWVLLARTPADLSAITRGGRCNPLTNRQHLRAWTDDYSNVLAALDFQSMDWRKR